MSSGLTQPVTILAIAGIAGGLILLVRGFGGYRAATRLADTATSRIASIAAGEVAITGAVEPAELTLVSPLQSVTCVYYRASVDEDGDRGSAPSFAEERGVGFVVRDPSGAIRVFPRGASWDVPNRFDERSDVLAGEPAGLALRSGPAVAPGEPDRARQIAALLTVHPAASDLPNADGATVLDAFGGLARPAARASHYREARLEPGDVVTVLGRAVPFASLSDPSEADVAETGAGLAADDPAIAADLAEARAAGTLASNPETAWGNAAIPGFGIGRPVRAPELDPEADRPALATPAEAARAARTFDIPADSLVIAAGPDVALVVAAGPPRLAVAREERRFLVGLLGAVLAIASAVTLALLASGSLDEILSTAASAFGVPA